MYYSRDEINIFNLEAHAACAPTREPPRIRDWGMHLAAVRESMIPLEEEVLEISPMVTIVRVRSRAY